MIILRRMEDHVLDVQWIKKGFSNIKIEQRKCHF